MVVSPFYSRESGYSQTYPAEREEKRQLKNWKTLHFSRAGMYRRRVSSWALGSIIDTTVQNMEGFVELLRETISCWNSTEDFSVTWARTVQKVGVRCFFMKPVQGKKGWRNCQGMQRMRLNENMLVARKIFERVQNIQIFKSYHIVCDVSKR